MCDKLPYNGRRIDPCLIFRINEINLKGILITLASCCGHGKYNSTIVVKEKTTGKIYEYYSGIELGVRKMNRYYKRDEEGYYYIPEVK